MVNRKGFAVRQLIIAVVIVGFLLIVAVAVPNVMRQTRNSSRTQDVHVLAIALKDMQLTSSNAGLPESCNNTQAGCFTRDAKLAYYDNTSSSDTVITYYRNTKPFDKFSPQLDMAQPGSSNRVIMHTYTRCEQGAPTGDGANRSGVVALYAIETFKGSVAACKQL